MTFSKQTIIKHIYSNKKNLSIPCTSELKSGATIFVTWLKAQYCHDLVVPKSMKMWDLTCGATGSSHIFSDIYNFDENAHLRLWIPQMYKNALCSCWEIPPRVVTLSLWNMCKHNMYSTRGRTFPTPTPPPPSPLPMARIYAELWVGVGLLVILRASVKKCEWRSFSQWVQRSSVMQLIDLI